MKHPQDIETTLEKSTYFIPTYGIDNNGLFHAGHITVQFCKGNKADEDTYRQNGLLTETLIALAKKYLEENNVGELSSRETAVAITKLDEALMWLNKRAEDRKIRGVQGTYQK